MSKHAIIVIKNEIGNYLQYFDERWNGYLFFNCKVEDNNEDFIKEVVSKQFDIEKTRINCKYFGYKKHSKYSESHKIMKEYEHYFFDVNFKLTDIMLNKEYEINSIKYKWFSYDELKCDKRIQEINSDIVSFIKEFNL